MTFFASGLSMLISIRDIQNTTHKWLWYLCSSLCNRALMCFGQAQEGYQSTRMQKNLACLGTASQFGANFAEASLLCSKILQRFSKIFQRSVITLPCISSPSCHSSCHLEQQAKRRFSHGQWKDSISRSVPPHSASLAPCVVEKVWEKKLSLSAAFLRGNPTLKGSLTEEQLLPDSSGSWAKQLLLLQVAAVRRGGKSSAGTADAAGKGRERPGLAGAADSACCRQPFPAGPRPPPGSSLARAPQHPRLTHCRYRATNQRPWLLPDNHCGVPLANQALLDKALLLHRFRRLPPCQTAVTFRESI